MEAGAARGEGERRRPPPPWPPSCRLRVRENCDTGLRLLTCSEGPEHVYTCSLAKTLTWVERLGLFPGN